MTTIEEERTVMITEKCSLFKPYFFKGDWRMGTTPETVSIIDMLLIEWQPEVLQNVRGAKSKDEKSEFKRKLWGITPSSVQEGGRGIENVVEHSGLLQFDIDPADNPILSEPGGMAKVKKCLVNIPYTLYCGLSASATGFWGLFRLSHPHLHTQHFDAMSKAFKDLGIKIDHAPRSIASLRFVSYDPDGFYNEDAAIFDLRIEPLPVERKPLVIEGGSDDDSDGKELINKFNSECTAELMHEILINFGFNYHSHRGRSYRFTRPGKATKAGLSVDYHDDKRTLYCFSSEVPGLEHWKEEKSSGWSCSPITALLLYGCGGKDKQHWAMAFNYIKSKL